METFLDYMKTPWISSDLSAWYLFQPNCLVWTVSQRTYNSVEQVSTSVLGDLETCRWLAGRWKVMATLSLTHTSWINWVLTYWSSISLPLAFLANLTYSSSFFLTLVSCTNMQSDVKIKQKLMTVNMCKISMDPGYVFRCTYCAGTPYDSQTTCVQLYTQLKKYKSKTAESTVSNPKSTRKFQNTWSRMLLSLLHSSNTARRIFWSSFQSDLKMLSCFFNVNHLQQNSNLSHSCPKHRISPKWQSNHTVCRWHWSPQFCCLPQQLQTVLTHCIDPVLWFISIFSILIIKWGATCWVCGYLNGLHQRYCMTSPGNLKGNCEVL